MKLTEKQINIVSIAATIMAVSMYVSYIPQIQANLAGHKGAPLQPLIAAINCTLWVVSYVCDKFLIYGALNSNSETFVKP